MEYILNNTLDFQRGFILQLFWQKRLTPLKFNMEPENNGFQMDFPFPGTYFQVPC